MTLALILVLASGLGGCTFFSRAFTYPSVDPILDTEWYDPVDKIEGQTCAPLPQASAEDKAIFGKALEQAAAHAQTEKSCALLVLHRGRIVMERYWCEIEAQTPVNTMSMSKTVVALAVGAAISQGQMGGLNDPIGNYLPAWRDDDRGSITIEQFLQMSSGLRNGNMIRIHIGTKARQDTLDTPLLTDPGTEFKYNNINTLILTLALEQATGMRFADYLSESIWKPMGGSDASIWLDREGGLAKTYCCLLANARDWAHVGQLLLNRGRVGERQVVPSDFVQRMLAPSSREENYGYHIWLGYTRPQKRYPDWSEPFSAPDVAMVTGQEEQRVFVIPSHELVIVRLGHESPGWDDTVLPNLLVEALDSTSIAQH